MKTFTLPGVAAAVAACGLSLAAQTPSPAPKTAPRQASTPATKPAMAVAHKTDQPAAEPQPDVVKTYCVGCHNDRGKDRAGSLTLASFDASHAEQQPEIAEKMIQKLRAGMMPPPGARASRAGGALAVRRRRSKTRSIAAAALKPNPGRRPFQRLNRAEYAALGERAPRCRRRRQRVPAARHDERRLRQHRRRADLLGDADGRLPARAPQDLDPRGRRSQRERRPKPPSRCRAPQSQMQHIDGTPWGTRGGIVARPHVPGRRRILVPRSCCTARRRASCSAACSSRERADRCVDQRRARRAARHQLPDDRDRQERPEPDDAARFTSKRARSTSRRRSSRSSTASIDDLMAPIDYTLADTEIRRQRRHHDPAARARLQHHRSVPRHRRLRYAEPPQDLHLPADVARRRNAVRAPDPRVSSRAKPTAGRRRAATSSRC